MAADPFLSYIRSIKTQASKAGLLVLGNQGADLDSIASALVLAWHLAGQAPPKGAVGLIAICRHNLRLRPEAAFVFARAGIDTKDLLFSDDVELEMLVQQEAELVLVDHNSIEATLPGATARVVAIIDHHHDEGKFPDASPRIIAEVGSTATLIGELVFREKGEMAASAALLLLSAILMDTANLSAKAGRSTARDKKMVSKLLSICGVEQETFFTSLQQARDDLTGLNSAELLARDYKEWASPAGTYGTSSVFLSLTGWQDRDSELASAITQFAAQKKVRVLLVMLASHNPGFQRELILCCRDKELHAGLTTFLASQGLLLSAVQETLFVAAQSSFMSMYSQGNTAISRKQLQPLVHTFLASALFQI